MKARTSLGVAFALVVAAGVVVASRSDPVQDAGRTAPVVFVCRNGVAMSVWSAAYFNRLAAERGLARARHRTRSDSELSGGAAPHALRARARRLPPRRLPAASGRCGGCAERRAGGRDRHRAAAGGARERRRAGRALAGLPADAGAVLPVARGARGACRGPGGASGGWTPALRSVILRRHALPRLGDHGLEQRRARRDERARARRGRHRRGRRARC